MINYGTGKHEYSSGDEITWRNDRSIILDPAYDPRPLYHKNDRYVLIQSLQSGRRTLISPSDFRGGLGE